MLIGHSDSNGSEDTAITVCFLASYPRRFLTDNRSPSITTTGRTSTLVARLSASVLDSAYFHLFLECPSHMCFSVFNNYYLNMSDGINTRDEAQLLVQNNVWEGTCSSALYSTDGGYAYASGNDFGTCESGNTALSGSLSSVPYQYTLTATSSVKSSVIAGAGPNLTF